MAGASTNGVFWAPPNPHVLPLHLPLTEHVAEEGGKAEGTACTLRAGAVSVQKHPQLWSQTGRGNVLCGTRSVCSSHHM